MPTPVPDETVLIFTPVEPANVPALRAPVMVAPLRLAIVAVELKPLVLSIKIKPGTVTPPLVIKAPLVSSEKLMAEVLVPAPTESAPF